VGSTPRGERTASVRAQGAALGSAWSAPQTVSQRCSRAGLSPPQDIDLLTTTFTKLNGESFLLTNAALSAKRITNVHSPPETAPRRCTALRYFRLQHQGLFVSLFLCSFVSVFLCSCVPFFLSSFLPFFLSSFLPFFLSSFLPFFLSSFLPFFLCSVVPLFLSSFLFFFLCSFIPLLLCCFLLLCFCVSVFLCSFDALSVSVALVLRACR
jgi:hypothetical protein